MTPLQRLKIRTGESDDDLLNELLEEAAEVILSLRYPLPPRPSEVPEEYAGLQVRMAIELYDKIGATGETAHNENGISRTYDSAWISKELRQEVVPLCGVRS